MFAAGRLCVCAVSIKNPHKSKWASLVPLLKSCSLMKKPSINFWFTGLAYNMVSVQICRFVYWLDHIMYTVWSAHYFNHTDILFEGVEQAMKKWEGNPKIFLQLPQVPLHYSSLPPPIGSAARGHRPPNEEVGGTMHCGPQLWLQCIITAQYLDCISVLTSFGASFRCTIASKLSASPLTLWLCPGTALGAPPPEPHYTRKRAKMHHLMQDIQIFLGKRPSPIPQYCS